MAQHPTNEQQAAAERPAGAAPAGWGAALSPGGRRWLTVPRIVAVCVAVATVAILLRGLLTPAQQAKTTAGSPYRTPLPEQTFPLANHPEPAIALLDLAGKPISLASLRGKVVVLNFWYVACEPCQLEMPALEKTYRADASKGLDIVGLNTSDDAPAIAQFARGLGVTYPLWRDADYKAVVTFSVTATPTSFIIDRQGVVRARYVGAFTDQKTLDPYIQPLLAQS